MRFRQWHTTHAAAAWAAAGDTVRLKVAGDTVRLKVAGDRVEKDGLLTYVARDRRLHHFLRGLLWKARGNDREAVAEYRRAPSSPTARYHRINYELAMALEWLGQRAEAKLLLQQPLRGGLEGGNLYLYLSRKLVFDALDRLAATQ